MSCDCAKHYPPSWFTEAEAAEYCRCSIRAFRGMRLPAQNSGGRKVYHRDALDAALMSRSWESVPKLSSAGPKAHASTDSLKLWERLKSERLRPYKPRKKASE